MHTYAAIILHDDGNPIVVEKIATLVKAANVKIDSYWPPLFAKLLKENNVDDLIFYVGSASVSTAAVAGGGGGGDAVPAAAPESEEKKKEEAEESDDEMTFSLFD